MEKQLTDKLAISTKKSQEAMNKTLADFAKVQDPKFKKTMEDFNTAATKLNQLK